MNIKELAEQAGICESITNKGVWIAHGLLQKHKPTTAGTVLPTDLMKTITKECTWNTCLVKRLRKLQGKIT